MEQLGEVQLLVTVKVLSLVESANPPEAAKPTPAPEAKPETAGETAVPAPAPKPVVRGDGIVP